MPSRYQPLVDFLAAQPPETLTVTLTLPEIEALLGWRLSGAAATKRWWASARGRGQVRSRMWLAVGWWVARATMRQVQPRITFARVAPDTIV